MSDAPAHAAPPPPPLEAETNPWVTNLILLVAVVALGAWVALGEGQTRSSVEISQVEGQVFSEAFAYKTPFNVIGVEIQRGEETVRITREPKESDLTHMDQTEEGQRAPTGWQMTSPVEDRGDDQQIFRLLKRIETDRIGRKPLTGKPALEQLAGFTPALKVTITRREGLAPFSFELAEPIGGEVALRLVGEAYADRLYYLPLALHQELTRPSWTWRNRTLLSGEEEAVREVSASVANVASAGVTLLRAPGGWRVGGAEGDLAEPAKVTELVETLRALGAASIEADAPDAAALERFGLASPQVVLRLRTEQGEDSLELGDWIEGRVKERYGRLASRPSVVYGVPAASLDALVKIPARDYLDPVLFPVLAKVEGVSALGAEVGETRWKVEDDKDAGWRFVEEGDPACDKTAVESLISALLELKIRERLDAPAAELGLAEPGVKLELWERDYRHVITIGDQLETGVFAVERLLPNPAGPDAPPVAHRYAVEIGALVADLAAGPLDLLSKRIFQASSWDARQIVVKDREGEVLLTAKWLPKDPANPQGQMEWRVTGQPDADPEAFKAYMKNFDDLNAQRYVARSAGAELADYGLERPERFEIEVETFEGSERKRVARTLLLGDRVGTSVYAMAEGGRSIGLIDASFRDRIAKGFGKQHVLLRLDVWGVREVSVERDGVMAWSAVKPSANWRWDAPWKFACEEGLMPQAAYGALEDLLEGQFETLRISRTEPATRTRLAETGLDAPALRITIRSRGETEAEPSEHVLLIGATRGERERWAMLEGGEVLGVLFDKPVVDLERLIRAQPGPPPFPPAEPATPREE